VSLPPFQAVLDAHGPVVWRYLAAAAGPVDAADCYQETFIAALRAYPRLRADSNLRGWLLSIAQRKVIDAWRARQRRPVPVDELPEAAVATRPSTGLADDGLWAAVRDLPPKQRSAVVHRFVGDLSYVDIAALLGCSEDAARQNVHAGLERLRALGVGRGEGEQA